jgi:uncharacterized integral membrane protein
VARATATDQIATRRRTLLLLLLMTDETPDADKARIRRQPPVPLALAAFLAAVVGFMLVVTGLFALMRYLGKH